MCVIVLLYSCFRCFTKFLSLSSLSLSLSLSLLLFQSALCLFLIGPGLCPSFVDVALYVAVRSWFIAYNIHSFSHWTSKNGSPRTGDSTQNQSSNPHFAGFSVVLWRVMTLLLKTRKHHNKRLLFEKPQEGSSLGSSHQPGSSSHMSCLQDQLYGHTWALSLWFLVLERIGSDASDLVCQRGLRKVDVQTRHAMTWMA